MCSDYPGPRQVFGLFMIRFRQVFELLRVHFDRFHCNVWRKYETVGNFVIRLSLCKDIWSHALLIRAGAFCTYLHFTCWYLPLWCLGISRICETFYCIHWLSSLKVHTITSELHTQLYHVRSVGYASLPTERFRANYVSEHKIYMPLLTHACFRDLQ